MRRDVTRQTVIAGLMLTVLLAPASPAAAQGQTGSMASCIAGAAREGALQSWRSLLGIQKLNTDLVMAAGSMVAVGCSMNQKVNARNVAGKDVLDVQVAQYRRMERLFNFQQRVGFGVTPGTETQVGRGALAFVRAISGSMTETWFQQIATGARIDRARAAGRTALQAGRIENLFHDPRSGRETAELQGLYEGAVTQAEAAYEAEAESQSVGTFADTVEFRFRTGTVSQGQGSQYRLALELRRAMATSQRLHMAISDLRSTADEVSITATQSPLDRATATQRRSW